MGKIKLVMEYFKQFSSILSAKVGLILFFSHILLACFATYIIPYDYGQTDSFNILKGPNMAHWLGTDQLGRDILSRTIMGGRVALFITFFGSSIAIFWGSCLGVFIGFVGGRFDEIVMRFIDALLSIPWILFLLLIISVLGQSDITLILTLGFFYGIAVIRVVRGATLDVITHDYILAARLRGDRTSAIIRYEILPNIMNVILVDGAMRWSWMLLIFSSLSFLGFGVNPPTPDWGLMIADTRGFMSVAPWATLAPLIALSSLIFSINIISDALSKVAGITHDNSSPV
ncbi:ABC transporter permease [Desulfotalea psychrophila]|uniref:Related to peptide ABC-transporter, permease protein n=1 Tax=Desulfotalea psychrophila (strain LSv54 / DSM 12343) TaxID=177439 RepID=Q6ANY8_DESPS|nr:ABC transporter permease [Desulfotalea psychrophila]CAG35936.1 related to peptide ABC-transporter, permease protein [Desulfotalea psychrophila LSv54]